MNVAIPDTTVLSHVRNESDPVAKLVDELTNLRRAGKMTLCVGKMAAVVAVRFQQGDVFDWARYGASCAYAKASPRLGMSFENFLNT